MVPRYAVKELCFGFCPAVFRRPGEKLYADEPKGIGSLQLGSMDEIAETLVVLGCNANTVNIFRDTSQKARYGHLFPIPFEILGMTSIVFQVKGTVFRTLPNPAVFRWEPKSFDLLALLTEYGRALKQHAPQSMVQREEDLDIAALLDTITTRFAEWKALEQKPAAAQPPSLPAQQKSGMQASAATARDVESGGGAVTRRQRWGNLGGFSAHTTASAKQTAQPKQSEDPVLPHDVYSPAVFEALHDAIEACDRYLDPQANGAAADSLLRLVLRIHVQAALELVNRKVDEGPGKVQGPTIQDLDATSDQKHSLLMEMYFRFVRENVVDWVCQRQQVRQGVDVEQVKRETGQIWSVLVFRMLCWLLLHHFHERDVQVSKSDVYESRMPVYIV